MKTTFIYCLIDPRDNQIRYIGKSNNLEQRLKNHCNPARYRPTYKFNWIRKLKKLNLKPILKIVEEVSIDIWKEKEKYWIDYFLNQGCNLVNYLKGGEGLTYGNQTSFKKGNIPWNKDTIKSRSCRECNVSFITNYNNSQQLYCSYKCAGLNRDSDTQFSKGHIPWNKGLKGRKIKPNKNVHQYSALTGEFIKTWDTAKQASITLKGSEASIANCARGITKTSGGFVWKYTKVEKVEIVKYKRKTNNSIKNNLK